MHNHSVSNTITYEDVSVLSLIYLCWFVLSGLKATKQTHQRKGVSLQMRTTKQTQKIRGGSLKMRVTNPMQDKEEASLEL